MDLLLCRGDLVFPDRIETADLLICGEKIARISPFIDPSSLPTTTRVVDCSGLLVFPGFIDAHTHFGLGAGENRTADGFLSGTAAAAVGGVTTFIDFSDQLIGMTLVQGAETRIREAADSVIDFTLHQGVYRFHPGIADELDQLAGIGIRALKIFTTYKKFGVKLDPSAWDSLFTFCTEKRFLVTIHAEDDEIIDEIDRELESNPLGIHSGEMTDKGGASTHPGSTFVPGPSFHPFLRPSEAEASAILKTGLCALQHHLPIYFVHISSAAGLSAVMELRKQGLNVIAETTPHYLLLTETDLIGEDQALFLMTPPLRTPEDRMALCEALASGRFDVVATDHCAYTPEQKRCSADSRLIPAGIPGTGEAASLLFSLLKGDIVTKASALCSLFSRNPAEVFGLYPSKGSLEPGTDGDVVIFDPYASGTISKDTIRTKAGYSPYEGFGYQGVPVMTILRGVVIAESGNFVGTRGSGRFLHCREPGIFKDYKVKN
jgi:dihydropyrimidinase